MAFNRAPGSVLNNQDDSVESIVRDKWVFFVAALDEVIGIDGASCL